MDTIIVQDSCGRVFWLTRLEERIFFRDPDDWAYKVVTHCPCGQRLTLEGTEPWFAPPLEKPKRHKLEGDMQPPHVFKVHLPGGSQDTLGDISL